MLLNSTKTIKTYAFIIIIKFWSDTTVLCFMSITRGRWWQRRWCGCNGGQYRPGCLSSRSPSSVLVLRIMILGFCTLYLIINTCSPPPGVSSQDKSGSINPKSVRHYCHSCEKGEIIIRWCERTVSRDVALLTWTASMVGGELMLYEKPSRGINSFLFS